MYVTLKAYLERLEAQERARSADRRRSVPNLGELAIAVNIHPVTMSKIAGTKIEQLNLKTGAAIIGEMRRRGFPMEVSDLLSYSEPDEGTQ